jgi:hypothetical protein
MIHIAAPAQQSLPVAVPAGQSRTVVVRKVMVRLGCGNDASGFDARSTWCKAPTPSRHLGAKSIAQVESIVPTNPALAIDVPISRNARRAARSGLHDFINTQNGRRPMEFGKAEATVTGFKPKGSCQMTWKINRR